MKKKPKEVIEIQCPLERRLLLEALNLKIWDTLLDVYDSKEYNDEIAEEILPYLRALRDRLEVF